MYQRILVPIDGSEPAKAAIHEVVNIAADHTRQIRLLHVADLSPRKDNFTAGSVGDIVINSIREEGQRHLDEGKETLSKHGIDCDTVLVESHGESMADLILDQARRWPAQLIVMGTHGRKGLSRLVLGSDAAEVVRSALVAVLLVRAIPSPQDARSP